MNSKKYPANRRPGTFARLIVIEGISEAAPAYCADTLRRLLNVTQDHL
jgi:hypothetical protein